MKQLLFPNNIQFWYETLRSMSHIAYGGADFGEVVSTGERITEGDYDSWYTEWAATAERVSAEAEKALAAGHEISARDGFLRASNYYRSAEFFLHGNPCDPRHDDAYDRSVACYRAAAALFTPVIEPISIPYEGTTLPGYLYRVDDSGTPRPTLIMHNGFDGTAEELHFFGAMAGVERGYTVLVFDGPGMPGPRHHEGLVFRPDWENVITPVVDFAETLPEVDNSRIALLGISMGGVLAPRAAAFEHRLAALVAVDGLYDLGETSARNIPGTREEAERLLRARSAPELDAAMAQLMTADPIARWAINHGIVRHGCRHPPGIPRLLPRLHPRRRHRREDPVPHPGVRGRGRHVLRRPGPAALRPPQLPQDPPGVHRRGRRRSPLPHRRPAPGHGPHPRLARHHPQGDRLRADDPAP